jgi:hypothetical protein
MLQVSLNCTLFVDPSVYLRANHGCTLETEIFSTSVEFPMLEEHFPVCKIYETIGSIYRPRSKYQNDILGNA